MIVAATDRLVKFIARWVLWVLASGKYCRFQQHIDRGISEGVLTSREPVQQGSLFLSVSCVCRGTKDPRGASYLGVRYCRDRCLRCSGHCSDLRSCLWGRCIHRALLFGAASHFGSTAPSYLERLSRSPILWVHLFGQWWIHLSCERPHLFGGGVSHQWWRRTMSPRGCQGCHLTAPHITQIFQRSIVGVICSTRDLWFWHLTSWCTRVRFYLCVMMRQQDKLSLAWRLSKLVFCSILFVVKTFRVSWTYTSFRWRRHKNVGDIWAIFLGFGCPFRGFLKHAISEVDVCIPLWGGGCPFRRLFDGLLSFFFWSGWRRYARFFIFVRFWKAWCWYMSFLGVFPLYRAIHEYHSVNSRASWSVALKRKRALELKCSAARRIYCYFTSLILMASGWCRL